MPELQEKAQGSSLRIPECRYVAIAKEAGFSITAEDIQSMQLATVELSDEELEGANGANRYLKPSTKDTKARSPRCHQLSSWLLVVGTLTGNPH